MNHVFTLFNFLSSYVKKVQVIIPSVILWVIGVKQLQQYAKYFDDHMDEFNYEPSFEWFVKYLEKGKFFGKKSIRCQKTPLSLNLVLKKYFLLDAEAFETLNVSLSLVYVVACCLEIFGAYKVS